MNRYPEPSHSNKRRLLSIRHCAWSSEFTTMDTQVNYIGAAIFWLYIIAALFFSTLIVYTLFETGQVRTPNKSRDHKAILAFSILAVVSFAALSINMLNVLVQSFHEWSARHQPFLSRDLGTAIWRWSLNSTLFRDFAEGLVATDARYLWSETALLATFAVSTFMSIEGETSVLCANRR